jgi:hypothetical protein
MTPPKLDLARRAVACREWRLLPGMRRLSGYRITKEDLADEPQFRPSDILPDLTDPATLGCLLHFVREAWGDPMMSPRPIDGRWCMYSAGGSVLGSGRYLWGATEAEALVVALEAAHRRAGGAR